MPDGWPIEFSLWNFQNIFVMNCTVSLPDIEVQNQSITYLLYCLIYDVKVNLTVTRIFPITLNWV